MIKRYSQLKKLNLYPGLHEFLHKDVRIVYQISETSPENIEIASLRTKSRSLGKGQAREAMLLFLQQTDAANKDTWLLAGPLNRETKLFRLVSFYSSLGYVPTGRTNFVGEPYMKRVAK